jgi:hypothetical protein
LLHADLQRSKEKGALSGKITSLLPIPLEDVVIYAGSGADAKWYSLGRLVPEVPVTVANIHAAGTRALSMDEWLQTGPAAVSRGTNAGRSRFPAASESTLTVIKKLLFFTQSDNSGRRDSALRYLDQSWRLRHKDEVILFGRVERAEEPAEELTATGTAPSRLWLGSLPAMGQPRPPLSGTLAQETFVRMIVPVRTAE